MSQPICIFYHCLFYKGSTFLPQALDIALLQFDQAHETRLLANASELVVGINGGHESLTPAALVFPPEARIVLHGLQCRNELRTILELQRWVPSHEDWLVFYFHCKGATRPPGDRLRANWRACMMRNLVTNWRQCVKDIENGCDMAGCHWMTGDKTPPGQSIFAGNFWWAKASFLKTLPPVEQTERVKLSGLDSAESRYEGEVLIGNGPRLPIVKDYHNAWIDTCQP